MVCGYSSGVRSWPCLLCQSLRRYSPCCHSLACTVLSCMQDCDSISLRQLCRFPFWILTEPSGYKVHSCNSLQNGLCSRVCQFLGVPAVVPLFLCPSQFKNIHLLCPCSVHFEERRNSRPNNKVPSAFPLLYSLSSFILRNTQNIGYNEYIFLNSADRRIGLDWLADP
jgi:hypothetical protein